MNVVYTVIIIKQILAVKILQTPNLTQGITEGTKVTEKSNITTVVVVAAAAHVPSNHSHRQTIRHNSHSVSFHRSCMTVNSVNNSSKNCNISWSMEKIACTHRIKRRETIIASSTSK